MKWFDRKHRKSIVLLILFWVLAGNIYVVVRFVGHSSPIGNPLDGSSVVDNWFFIALATSGGVVVGILYGFLETLFENKKFRRMGYGRLILIKSVFYILMFLLTFAGITIWDYMEANGKFDITIWAEKVFSKMLIIPLGYISMVAILLNFLRLVSLKFGPGNLWKMLIGSFHHPKEENRIFMFLDLKSSTTIAERLGHIKYSRLIQDCFNDLYIVEQNEADVYQYVGDEAVLSWDVGVGVKDNNCLKAYFNFTRLLNSKKEYYNTEYGIVPEFKAGMNAGMVTVAEVGVVKKDIAFHGDTLNTASRIQDKCVELRKNLLISGFLEEKLGWNHKFSRQPIGKIQLRGKEREIQIFSVEEIN